MSDSLHDSLQPRQPGAERPQAPRVRFTATGAASGEPDGAWIQLATSVVVVRVEVGPAARGRLADVIDEAIERELDARGAAPPGVGASSDADAALSDQLFRARRAGGTGIALSLGPLRAATNAAGAIEPEDSATVRFWAKATSDRPVWLFLDASDRNTGAYGEPIALGTLIDVEVEDDDPTPAVPRVDDPAPSPRPADTTPTAPPIPTVNASPAPSPTPDPASATAPSATPPDADPAPRPTPALPAPSEWRAWTTALTAARGPQPLAAFERLFTHDYVPLANAVAAGLDDARAVGAVDEFRHNFARAYAEACPTFAVTGKRPKMVLDAPEVAARIARLHGARSTQLLLVDGMRFDVGARVAQAVRAVLGPRASMTDHALLWSALPTTTTRQLETLARGVDALRAPSADSEREGDALRGRTADVIRRVKIGSRDVYKLDAVEARVRENGALRAGGSEGAPPGAPAALAALPFIADAAADVIVRHASSLQPRTLLFVFGDHGFTLDREGRARQGGASPEEVLVPAFALLVGDVH